MVSPITDVKAPGSFVLVEMLTPQEAAGTAVLVHENSKEPPQGYIVDIGPMVEVERWGFSLGARVLLQGSYIPVPAFKRVNDRKLGIVMPSDIKAILIEASE